MRVQPRQSRTWHGWPWESEGSSRAPLARLACSGLLLALIGTTACFRAPEVSGPDQVYDANVEATALKDGEFESMSWQDIDDLMTTRFVDDPDDEPGCAVGVVRDGEILYLQGYGYSRMPSFLQGDSGERWGVDTMGAVGSISKTLTAAAALQMHERGYLNVNGSVGQHLNTSNSDLGNRMVANLLNHKAGVGGPTRGDAFEHDWMPDSFVGFCADGTIPASDCGVVSEFIARPLYAFTQYEATEPVEDLGTAEDGLGRSVYSNVGYSVAGAIIDRAAHDHTTSDGYEAYVWDEVANYSDNPFEPGHLLSLALTHSWRDADIPHRAVGYVAGGGFSKWEAWQGTGTIEGWEGPSGGWAMTIGDLSRLMIAVDRASFFDSALYRNVMRHEWSNLDSFDDNYGMGMFLGAGGTGAPEYWHGGAIGGQSLGVVSHNAVWAWWDDYEGREIGVALMCNRSDAGVTGLKRQTDEIAEIVRYGNPDPPSQISFAKLDQTIPRGTMFQVDPRGGWQADAKRAFVPIGLIDLTLTLTVEGDPRRPDLRLTQGKAAGEKGIAEEPTGKSALLRSARYVDPGFSTEKIDWSIDSTFARVEIQDLQLEGSFTKGGQSIDGLVVSGQIDTRQFGIWGKAHPLANACRDIAKLGGECGPCKDSRKSCIAFRYENLSAARIAVPSARSATERLR